MFKVRREFYLKSFHKWFCLFLSFQGLVILASVALAHGYGSMGGGYGGGGGYSMGGGGYGGGGGGSGYGGGVIPAAILSRHNVQYYDVPSTGYIQPTTIEVGANHIPLNLLFRSASSNLNVQQVHMGAKGSYQQSQSEDEPHILKHSVTKPIYQEVREVVMPYRKITQEIRPVQEEIQTLVARNAGGGYGGGGMGGGYGGGAGLSLGGGAGGGYGGSKGGY